MYKINGIHHNQKLQIFLILLEINKQTLYILMEINYLQIPLLVSHTTKVLDFQAIILQQKSDLIL